MSYQYSAEKKEATIHTKEYNQKLRDAYNPDYIAEEKEDIELLNSHLVYEFGEEDAELGNEKIIWRNHSGNLAQTKNPDTVNPYLWEVAKTSSVSGIVELVKNKIYISYGIGTAPIGFIRSNTGWIIQDAGTNMTEAKVVLKTFETYIGENVRENIKALIISHTHYDHFGGAQVFTAGKEISVYGPASYEQSLINDNLYAGIAMSRRLQYQGGTGITQGEKGSVPFLWGTGAGFCGKVTVVYPTVEISEDTIVSIDGVEIELIPAPDTETLAHLITYVKSYRTLYLADTVMGTVHNTYTMRGAAVRDANYWGELLYKLYISYGEEVEVIYAGHGVPHWKNADRPDNLKHYLLNNGAAYKFTNDQALLLANEGYSINEVGHAIKIPDSIKRVWYTRAHYGDYTFNARGTYQKYLGFYDGNPVHLLPSSEKTVAAKFIEYVGSSEKILEKAEVDFVKGEYQWVAEVTNHLVFYEPNNLKARYLCADALEQLGYQAESGLWRNAYLTAAAELREPGFSKSHAIHLMGNDETISAAGVELLLDHLGINFDGYRAEKNWKKKRQRY